LEKLIQNLEKEIKSNALAHALIYPLEIGNAFIMRVTNIICVLKI